MTPRTLAILGVLVGVAGGLAFALTRPQPRSVAPPPVVEPALPDEATDTPAAAPGTPQPLTAEDWEAALGGDPEPVSEDVPAPPATGTLSMPIAAKLAPEPLSAVPHELVGAWDDLPDSERPGAHRAIVAVVDPNVSDKDLEQLVWDIREQHRGAEILDVRVYDSAEAASRSSAGDGAAERASHLVAGVKRNDRLGYDEVTVRGRNVGP